MCCRQISSEISYAQQEKSDSIAMLRDINVELDRKRFELQDMKSNQVSRHKQIELLSELSQPVEHDFTYTFNDKYPSVSSSRNVTGKVVKDAAQDHSQPKKFRNGEVILLEKNLAETTGSTESLIHKIIEISTVSEEDLKVGNQELVVELESQRLKAGKLIATVNKCDRQSFASIAELLRLRLKIMV